jgi:hypothetical protein
MQAFSNRLHPVYKNIIRMRNNQMWGHLPMTDDIFEFFEQIGDYTQVNNILEFGFNFGFSASMQMTVFPNAKLVSYDPKIWRFRNAVYDKKHVMPISKKLSAPDLAYTLYYGRFKWHKEKSSNARNKYPRGHFDYAFIDGSHTEIDAHRDIKHCIEMRIKYLVIDNLNEPGVDVAVSRFGTRLKPLNVLEYYGVHPKEQKKVYDRIGLYEVTNDELQS